MNIDIKRHIDSARQVLVGVVPNPTSQIDQITNALIYKFMDDMDQLSIKNGGEPSFFIGNLEKYSWTRIMDSRIGNQERMNLFIEGFIKISESENIPQLFRNILKSAYLPYRSPEVLGLFLKEINYFDYSHPEDLGDAYEYLLSIMSSQGDAGQFRTPRHIIDFIVDAVNPTIEDKVLDPACGTAGFLISAYKHILEQHDGANDPEKKEKPLTPDQRKKLFNNFEGYDIDPGMVRIAQVNMYLHQFKNPKIFQYDSLSMEERWSDKFDVILANPPFMSPKGGIKPHSKFGVQSTRSEVLFVDYIINHLKPKGRAGIIVPEGIIFQSGTAYKQLRKNLVENGLYAVISLPSGVFNPYAGVKTSILLFNYELAKTSKEILFVKVKSDGYDLGAQRRPASTNDLPEVLEILNKWKSGEKTESSLVTYIEKTKIAENEYNLSGDRYGVTTDYTNAVWPMVELGEVAEILNGYTFKSEEYTSSGIRVIRITNVQKGKIIDDDPKYYGINTSKEIKKFLLYKNDLLVSLTGNVGRVGLLGSDLLPAALNQRVGCIRLIDSKRTSINYLFHILNANKFEESCLKSATGVAQKNLSTEWLKKYQIPLPPLEIQEQMVIELDDYQNIITGAKQIVSSWKPKVEISPEWPIVKMEEIALINDKSVAIKSEEKYHYIDISAIENGTGKITIGKAITGNELPSRARRAIKLGDVLLSTVRPNLKAFAYIKELPEYPVASTGFAVITAKDKAIGLWIYYLSLSEYMQEQMAKQMGKGAYPSINQTDVQNLTLPLPPLNVQQQIVEEIEAEHVLVESAKKLIEIYESKTKAVITKLWGE